MKKKDDKLSYSPDYKIPLRDDYPCNGDEIQIVERVYDNVRDKKNRKIKLGWRSVTGIIIDDGQFPKAKFDWSKAKVRYVKKKSAKVHVLEAVGCQSELVKTVVSKTHRKLNFQARRKRRDSEKDRRDYICRIIKANKSEFSDIEDLEDLEEEQVRPPKKVKRKQKSGKAISEGLMAELEDLEDDEDEVTPPKKSKDKLRKSKSPKRFDDSYRVIMSEIEDLEDEEF